MSISPLSVFQPNFSISDFAWLVRIHAANLRNMRILLLFSFQRNLPILCLQFFRGQVFVADDVAAVGAFAT